MTTDQVIAASNFASWTILLMVSAVLFSYVFHRRDQLSRPVVLALAGAAVEAAGWATHRFYWWIWRFERMKDDGDANWFVDHAWWTVGSFVLIMIGAAMMMSPVSRAIFGRWWPHASFVLVATVYTVGFLMTV